MYRFRPIGTFALAMTTLSLSTAALAENVKSPEETITYGVQGETDSATKLELTVYETPQTITGISQIQLGDFALQTVNDALNYAPGVTVEEVETDRTYYTARGFDIVNFQYDGVGIPFIGGINLGQQDTAIYEKVEVIKGAAGLVTGLANPSATINYIRKRPKDTFEGNVGLNVGSWNSRRIDADVTGQAGEKLRGRLVTVYDEADSYLDRHSDETNLVYGIAELDITDSSLLTVGYSRDKSYSDGVLWGALPLLYADGSATNYDVSTSNAPDWTFANNDQEQTFVEFTQALGDKWSFNAMLTRNKGIYDSELFYVYGTPNSAEDETGLFGWASAYQRSEEQINADIYFNGSFLLFGKEHELVFGYAHSDTDLNEKSFSDLQNGFPVLGNDWREGNTPSMTFDSHDPATQASDLSLKQRALYFASRLNPTENLSLLIGARKTDFDQNGISYGGSANAVADKTVPFYGLTYEVTDGLMFYGSYSEVFKQQTSVNIDLQPLGATVGEAKELGFKHTFNDNNAVLTAAWFSSKQTNFGEFAFRTEDGIAIYDSTYLESQGYEVELSGEVLQGLNVAAGYTHVDIENEQGQEIRPFIPEDLVKLSASYRLPLLPSVKVGALARWQGKTTTADALAEQESYTLLDAFVQYSVSDQLDLTVNIENLTDRKYLNSLFWTQAFYGEPRNVNASVRWQF